MTLIKMTIKPLALTLLVSAALSGCTTPQRHLSPDFGFAANQAVAAQIADPDARYSGAPAPGSNGARAGLAQDRYQTGKVIVPSATASTIGSKTTGSMP